MQLHWIIFSTPNNFYRSNTLRNCPLSKMQTSASLLVGIVIVLYVSTNVCLARCPRLSCLDPPVDCEEITSCPKGLKIGYPRCSCCQACVIPEGGYCSNNLTQNPQCEVGLICCRGVCSPYCEESTTESSSETTITGGSSASTTQTTTTEEDS